MRSRLWRFAARFAVAWLDRFGSPDGSPPAVSCKACDRDVPIPRDVLEGRADAVTWLDDHARTHHNIAGRGGR